MQCEPDCHFDPQIAVSILQLHFVILNFVHLNIGSSCHHELCYWLLCHGQNKEEICIIKGCMNKQALDGPLRELVEQKCPFWGPDYLGEGWKKRLRKLFHSFFSGREEVKPALGPYYKISACFCFSLVCPLPGLSFSQKRWMMPRHTFCPAMHEFWACNGATYLVSS